MIQFLLLKNKDRFWVPVKTSIEQCSLELYSTWESHFGMIISSWSSHTPSPGGIVTDYWEKKMAVWLLERLTKAYKSLPVEMSVENGCTRHFDAGLDENFILISLNSKACISINFERVVKRTKTKQICPFKAVRIFSAFQLLEAYIFYFQGSYFMLFQENQALKVLFNFEDVKQRCDTKGCNCSGR